MELVLSNLVANAWESIETETGQVSLAVKITSQTVFEKRFEKGFASSPEKVRRKIAKAQLT